MRVMIVVTHLLGTGHLSRALTLGRAFADAGHDVQLLSGGMPAPQLNHDGVHLVQLPALRSDGTNFTDLLDQSGQSVRSNTLRNRKTILLDALNAQQPDVLITELFPFGRRVLGDEFLSLLDQAILLKKRPVILASIRDILAPPSKPSRVSVTEDIVARYYDAVLVHSDPQITPLALSWPVSPKLDRRVRYTGYVAQKMPSTTSRPSGEVLVSAGGGGVGSALFRTAIDAAKLLPDLRWRILVGGANAGEDVIELSKIVPNHSVIIEPARPDFRELLTTASASVSMCGYNTALDLLQTGIPAVIVPFEEGGEIEQGLRAQGLAKLPGFKVIASETLTPPQLAQAVLDVMSDDNRDIHGIHFDGAQNTVRIASEMAKARL